MLCHTNLSLIGSLNFGFGLKIGKKWEEVLQLRFYFLIGILTSNLDDFCTSELVSECVFIFYNFYPIPRHGPEETFWGDFLISCFSFDFSS